MYLNPNSNSDSSYNKIFDNRLDEEIQKIVYPFRCVLYLFFNLKYRIRNNRIYPSGKIYRAFAFCWMLFLNVLCIYRTFNVEVRHNDKIKPLESTIVFVLCTGFFVTYFIEFTLMFIFDMINEENTILLLLKIQSIHRSIGSRKRIQSYITWNWISLGTIIFTSFVTRVLYYISSYYPHFMYSVYDVIIDAMFIALDVNIVISIRILVLLREYLNEWINNIKTMKADDEENHKMFEIYKSILLAYDLYKTVYRAFPLFHTFGEFYRNIMYFHLMIYCLRTSDGFGVNAYIHFAAILLWLINDLVLDAVFCSNCERFYITVEKAQKTCIQLLKNVNCSKIQRHLYKDLLYANRCFSKMTACGLFTVDAMQPINCIGLVAYYALVLLQFYLLE